MITSEAIDQLVTALSAAQGEIQGASKDGKGNFGKHLTLESVYAVTKEPLSKNGLAIIQAPSFADGRVTITTRLAHKSGQWIETELSLRPKQDNPQDVGSCITYGRRYSHVAIVGVSADIDDDGKAATHFDTDDKSKPGSGPTISPKQTNKQDDKNQIVIFDKDIKAHVTWLTSKVGSDYNWYSERLQGKDCAYLSDLKLELQQEKLKELEEPPF